MFEFTITTPDGTFLAAFTATGLARIEFPANRARPPQPVTSLPPRLRSWARTAERAVNQVLAGTAPSALPPLDLSAGTAFQQAVWGALRRIPAGTTRTYADIARTVRSPRASRAVGQACGANPIPLLVPCHRVVASGGRLGGFSGGLEWKRRLLAREGILPSS